MIEVTLQDVRQFQGIMKFLVNTVPGLRGVFEDRAKAIAEKTATALRDAVLNGDSSEIRLRLRKISKGWIDEKISKGWREEPLVASERYARAIKAVHKDGGHGVSLPDSNYPGRKFSYKDLATYLEFGTRRMDPLPHWGPAKDFFLAEMNKAIDEEIAGATLFR